MDVTESEKLNAKLIIAMSGIALVSSREGANGVAIDLERAQKQRRTVQELVDAGADITARYSHNAHSGLSALDLAQFSFDLAGENPSIDHACDSHRFNHPCRDIIIAAERARAMPRAEPA